MPLGIIASNSSVRGGILFPESCRKMAAFASLCDAFSIPLVFLADLPGFMVGKDAEQAGIIHSGALVFSTLATLSVPHLCIVMRKAYTAGFYAMGGAGFDPDRILALSTADITIYGIKAIDLLAENQDLPGSEPGDPEGVCPRQHRYRALPGSGLPRRDHLPGGDTGQRHAVPGEGIRGDATEGPAAEGAVLVEVTG